MSNNASNGMPRHHRLHLVRALTAAYGAAAVFGFGLLVGLLTEPVPSMPGGIHALAWLVLPLMVGVVFVPLAAAYRTAAPANGMSASQGLALVRPAPSQWTRQVHGVVHGVVNGVAVADLSASDSALERFPQEQTASTVATRTRSTSQRDVVRVAS